jgi:hypothetical protein
MMTMMMVVSIVKNESIKIRIKEKNKKRDVERKLLAVVFSYIIAEIP